MNTKPWWTADEGDVHKTMIDYVRGIDQAQYRIFDRFKKLEALYDPERAAPTIGVGGDRNRPMRSRDPGRMIENIVSQNINTLASQIATMDIRPTFDTDGADWGEQRRARAREWYAEELVKRYDVIDKCAHAWRVGTSLKGTGCMKVYANKFRQLCVDHVRPDNVVVDERAYPDGNPLEMFYRDMRDADAFAAEFPEFKRAIEAARGRYSRWAGWLPMHRTEILVVEGWRLPIGARGHENYVPGRHVICFEGGDVWDEEYHEDEFPIADHRYCKPPTGWYGIGMGEELASYQRALNKRNAQVDRQADHNANPIILAQRIDAKLAAQTVNTLGTIGVYDGRTPPQVSYGPAVSQDLLASRADIKSSAQAQSGVSGLAMQSRIPARLETGAGVREWAGAKTERFADKEKDFERFVIDVVVRMLKVCRDLGADAPKMVRRSKFGKRHLEWSKISTDDIRAQIGVASTLSRSRAGRLETVTELAQAGVISIDEARRLYGHPDIEREMSLYNAAIESADECLEEIADGKVVMPEPFMNLRMVIWRGQQQYLIWRSRKAPEDVLENLRMFVANAAWMLDQMESGSAAPGPAPSTADVIGPPGAALPGQMMPGLPTPEPMAAPAMA
jgi:hypothetical protein